MMIMTISLWNDISLSLSKNNYTWFLFSGYISMSEVYRLCIFAQTSLRFLSPWLKLSLNKSQEGNQSTVWKREVSLEVSASIWDDISPHQHQIWALYTLCKGLTCRYSWGDCSCLWEGGTVAPEVPDDPKCKLRNSSVKIHRCTRI